MGGALASIHSFSKGNISIIDDALIKAAIFAVCCALAVLIAYFKAGTTGASLLLFWAVGIAVFSVFLLLAGLFSRKREKQCIGLWRLLQTHPDIQLSLYLQQSGNTLSDVQRAARVINNAGAGFLVVDSVNDRLYDSRLNKKDSITFRCTSCGASSKASIGCIDGSAVVCQYCQAPAPADAIPNLNSKHEALIKSNLEKMKLLSNAKLGVGRDHQETTTVSIRVFITLLVLCWPAALGYVVWKKR